MRADVARTACCRSSNSHRPRVTTSQPGMHINVVAVEVEADVRAEASPACGWMQQ